MLEPYLFPNPPPLNNAVCFPTNWRGERVVAAVGKEGVLVEAVQVVVHLL
jgi:hypothetical protein